MLPALKSFCVFACVGIVGLYAGAVTFFVACVALNGRRQDARRNFCCCCYTHPPEYTENECSKKEILVEVLRNYYGPYLMKLPAKVSTSRCIVIKHAKYTNQIEFSLSNAIYNLVTILCTKVIISWYYDKKPDYTQLILIREFWSLMWFRSS